jgi:hypothetical protein
MRTWRRRREGSEQRVATTRVPLSRVLAEVPGKWVAVDRVTNELRAVADTPDALAMEVRRRHLSRIAVVRAPDPSEPELVGLG